MSLLKYFQAKGPTLPSSSTRAYSSLSRKDLDYANKEVKRALAAEDSGEKVVTRRGKYNSYTPEERAQIGKYALENGNSRAARHFSKVLDRQIRESTARRLKDEYVRALAQKKNDPEGPVVKCLPTKAQGRPLLLGQELDKAVQEYIEATRAAGGVVNTAIVMAAAVGIVSSRDVTKLSSNGGYVNITKTWAKSLLKRMGYVMKDGMRTRFQTWYASEVQKQLKDAPLDQVKVNVTAAAIKPLSANWVISTWQEIENRPDLAINGFRAAGIVGAVASIRD